MKDFLHSRINTTQIYAKILEKKVGVAAITTSTLFSRLKKTLK